MAASIRSIHAARSRADINPTPGTGKAGSPVRRQHATIVSWGARERTYCRRNFVANRWRRTGKRVVDFQHPARTSRAWDVQASLNAIAGVKFLIVVLQNQ